MAEFLVAHRDLPSGYSRGDPITVQRNGHRWGAGEGLPNFVVVKVPELALDKARQMVGPLIDPAGPGDVEFDAADAEDRIIVRGRARERFDLDTIDGTLTVAQMRGVVRKLVYDRVTGQVGSEA